MAEKPGPAAGRRQVLHALAGGVGAGLAAPTLVAAGAVPHAHPTAAPQAAAPPPAPAGFLDANQLATLGSFAEAVVPGSTAAGVAAFVDRLLAVDTRERQKEFLAALGALQAESLTRFGKPWLGLDAAQRTLLLTALTTGPSARTPHYWSRGEPVEPRAPERRPPTLRDRFELLKQQFATAYWSSEQGRSELGATGDMVHAEFSGCTHPDGHASGD